MNSDYQNYKTWLDGVNSINPPQQTEQDKEVQLQSDTRIKKYIVSAVKDDSVLAKLLGLSLITNGIVSEDLGKLYFLERFMRSK